MLLLFLLQYSQTARLAPYAELPALIRFGEYTGGGAWRWTVAARHRVTVALLGYHRRVATHTIARATHIIYEFTTSRRSYTSQFSTVAAVSVVVDCHPRIPSLSVVRASSSLACFACDSF